MDTDALENEWSYIDTWHRKRKESQAEEKYIWGLEK